MATAFNHKKYRKFQAVNKTNRRWPDQSIERAPLWCSVDLRDGNQALIDPMSVEQKQQLWHLLIKMGFKEIEVGFPSASKPDFDFVRWLIDEQHIPDDVTIQVLVQAREDLIARTYEAVAGAKRVIVHVYNSTSPTQRNKVFKQDRAGITAIAQQGAQWVKDYAVQYPDTHWQFEYSPESFSSTEVDYAVEVCNAVIAVWQPTPEQKIILNLPSTVENALPNHFADQIEWFCDHVHQRDSVIISVHPHNDRGTGVATGEMALLAGADRIEGTLLGNGERTGNMDIVTMGMNLYSQGIDPELDFSNADEIISTVEACTNIKTHPRHPWLGELVYTAFSGSHQDAIRKCLAVQGAEEVWDVAYLPIDPQDIGRSYQSVIRVNSQSGKGGAAYLVEQALGVTLPRWLQIEFSQVVQQATEAAQGELSSKEIVTLFEKSFTASHAPKQARFALQDYRINKEGTAFNLQAQIKDHDQIITIEGQGNGAISAFADALNRAFDSHAQVVQFDEQSLTQGSEAQAMAFVQLNIQGRRVAAVAQDNDTLSAGIHAILMAVNKAAA